MKKGFALLLVLCLLLTGCDLIPAKSTAPPETEPVTEAPTEAPTEPPTEAPTEPVYYNPLTGERIDAPLTTRVYGVSINNLKDALPRIGVCQADIYLETFVNGSIVRGLALFADPSDVPVIGPVRSTRYMFTDLALHYDLIMVHAGGSHVVLGDVRTRGADGFNIDTQDSTYYSFRDMDRYKNHYGWEHCLFARGEGLEEKALEAGINIGSILNKDYQLRFREDGTPEDGEDAAQIDLTLTFRTYKKGCSYLYDPSLGQYVYYQYDQEMTDGVTGEKEAYQNVLILCPKITMNAHGYQEADFVSGGEGYFACGGKIAPITFGAEDENSPLWFRNAEGEPLEMGVGRTFIAVTDPGSALTWE